MKRPIADESITEERVERALMVMAYIVATHGATYAPIFDRLERELVAMRMQTSPVERARRYLEAHTIDGIISIRSLGSA